jgi:hypothetical protein
VRDLVLEHIIVKRVIPQVDGDYQLSWRRWRLDFSTTASISTDLRPHDIADIIGDRLKCVYWLYLKRVCSCGHW